MRVLAGVAVTAAVACGWASGAEASSLNFSLEGNLLLTNNSVAISGSNLGSPYFNFPTAFSGVPFPELYSNDFSIGLEPIYECEARI